MSPADFYIDRVAQWLASSRSAVVLTGAGISTESGIPDFRSPGGVWSKYRTVYFDEFLASADGRYEYWRQKCEMHREFGPAQPNEGHQVLARWEAAGRIRGVITQNIDGLHQMAGSRRVLELHGTARQAACLDCSARYDIEPLIAQFLADDRVPDCPACGGRLKHATISFGQMLPPDVLMEATRWSRDADLMLAIGSSLVVTPAADLPRITRERGGRFVIINRDPTPLDEIADATIPGSIGETLTSLHAELTT
ncbi:MAG: Sir2 family NAD-dependent protein deacetylase [Planctomycetes bacterium]|nr:Sir2 family NAD-dependent protein deacetylase [Planctomycetota bacterium]